MNLAEYLFRNKLTVKAFSEMIEYQPEYVSGVKNGTRIPGKKMKDKIIRVTKGQVDFLTPQEGCRTRMDRRGKNRKIMPEPTQQTQTSSMEYPPSYVLWLQERLQAAEKGQSETKNAN